MRLALLQTESALTGIDERGEADGDHVDDVRDTIALKVQVV